MSLRTLRFVLALFTLPVAARAFDLDRELILTPPTTSTPEDAEIRRWQERVSRDAKRAEPLERLGWAYVAKARRTLDAGYYKLAEKTADVIDHQFGVEPASELLRGHVDHNLHRFAAAETIARRLVAERGMPDDFALLSDALMEQGKLTEAISALQQMANLKPGAEADTRIAHIRWLKGDLPGAIAAMEQAVRETSVADTTDLAWMLSQLAVFELQRGNLPRAAALAKSAVAHERDYAPALLAVARTELAAGRVGEALTDCRRAAELNPLPEYQWWLADIARAAGDSATAANAERQILERGRVADPRTFSLFLATRKLDAAAALELARAELGTRNDVLTRDAVAWAEWAAGESTAAAADARAALAEHTPDPRLRLHAAVIEQAVGHAAEARQLANSCRIGRAALLPDEQQRLDALLAALPGAPAVASAR